MATNLRRVRGRIYEADLIDWRGFRISQMQDWKARLIITDKLYRGAWEEVFPDESVMRENPHVMNMVQVGLNDVARLVSEAVPSIRCMPTKESQSGEREANIREAICDTYWEVNSAELLVPRIAMDIAGAGAAFMVAYVDDESEYPCLHRMDPRYCYPDVVNGRIQDLLVVEDMNLRTAARMFPKLRLPEMTINQKVEIIHYYSKDECVQGVLWQPPGNADDTKAPPPPMQGEITARWNPEGVLPVAFVQLDSFDGAIRGMYDQITGSLQTKNRIVKQLLDYTDEVVYAERFSKGLLNPEEVPGPMAHYRLDPNVDGAIVGRVPPAASAPQVFQILEYLDREQRGSASYPSARQGEISQSIASASFVASTQGQLTSTVRDIQRLIANLRQQLNKIMFHIDERKLNTTKSLSRPVGNKKVYSPKTDIAGEYRNRVVYGAGAGLDRLNADVRTLQLLGAQIISREDAREQIDFISDPTAVQNRVDLEATSNALLQKFLQEAPVDLLMQVLAIQATGKSLSEAVLEVTKAMKEQQAAQAQQEQAATAQAGAEAAAAAPGAAVQPGNVAPEAQPAFAPPPLEQVIVR